MLDYNIIAVASRAGLRSLLCRTIRGTQIEIDAGHGKLRVTALETGIFKVYLDKMMLYATDYRALSGKLTWNSLFQILDAAWFCFVIWLYITSSMGRSLRKEYILAS